jgi:putative PEP-CTERM system histidine kinase
MSFGAISYGAASVLFLLLTALLVASWRGHHAGGRLIAASAMTSIWAFVLMWADLRPLPLLVVYFVEVAQGGIWLMALMAIGGSAIPTFLVVGNYLAWIGLLALGLVFPFIGADLPGSALTALMSRGQLLLAVLGLVLLEQIYRNSDDPARRTLKWLVVGIGGLFTYDLFLYSQAELFRGISADAWRARGIVYALCVPLIAIAARRNPQWSLDVFVSRHVVFYSTTFIVVGIYLLLMALGGYYVRAVSGNWGVVGQILFVALATGLLITMVVSEPLRRRLRVFIHKHFYRNKYDYRVEWLRFIRTLSSADEGNIRRTALRAVTQILGSPGGALLMRDESGKRFVPAAAWPVDIASIPGLADIRAESELMRFLAERQWIIDLNEYRAAPEVYGNIDLPQWIKADPTLRIISPMLELDRLVGVFLLFSPPAPFELTYEDRDLLKTVGQHVATQIAQHEADRKLAESRQFEAYNRLTAFMMHDLKNSVAQLKLLVGNAERHKHNPEFIDDAISTIGNTVSRMTLLIEQLQGKKTGSVRVVALDELLAAAVHRCGGRPPEVTMELPGLPVLVRADSDRLAAVLEHVIRNAQDATPAGGQVKCSLIDRGREAVLMVTDTGSGMTPEFVRERLFRPFDSTKGAKGMGIGAYQSREYIRMIGGDVEVQSSPGKGSRFSITVPVYRDGEGPARAPGAANEGALETDAATIPH